MTAKSDRIRELLADPNVEEAFENVRRYLLELFEEASSDDIEMLQSISMRLNLLATVKADLEAAIEEGNYEDFKAQQSEERNVH